MSAGIDAKNDGTAAIQVGGTDMVKIDTAGNVGVGVTPSAWSLLTGLDINSFGAVYGYNNQVGMTCNAYYNSGFKYKGTGAATLYQQSAGAHIWQIAPSGTAGNAITFTQAMTLDADGNLGVGTASPTARLSARIPSATSTNTLVISATDGTYCDINFFLNRQTTLANSISQINTSAGIMTFATSGTERLRITDTGTLTSQPTYDNTATGSTVVVTSTGLIRRTSSSIKYKKDVETLDTALASNAVDNLRPVWYRTKNAEGDDKATWSHIGLIAEEVHEVEPRLVRYKTVDVTYDEEGQRIETELATPEPEDVDYARLSVLLLAEVKELKARIAALEAK